MNDYMRQVSSAARQAISRGEWPVVDACAREILKQDADSAEGHFLAGLFAKASKRSSDAAAAFRRVIAIDVERYDAAIELANLLTAERRNGEAAEIVRAYEKKLGNSPVYLNMAGNVYLGIGMPEAAWAMYRQATELQPGVALIEENLATTSTFLGKIDEARELLQGLLVKAPDHQRNHLSLARLDKATDREHIDAMLASLARTRLPPDRNVFMYYAIGKEFEDLGEWAEAFRYYKMAGDAVMSVANYDIGNDIALIDAMIATCTADWLEDKTVSPCAPDYSHEPIFVVGLPRTGTTLVDRIISSHSTVQSVGETQFMQMELKQGSGIDSDEKMTVEIIEAAARLDMQSVGEGYLGRLRYRLGPEPRILDKLPFNSLYLGFITAAFPAARIVLLRRNPMDSCFAMYKQVFTWAYKFSYSLDGLGGFYVAYDRLIRHWRDVLGERLVEVQYEDLVADPEAQTRALLQRIDLPFEAACLEFDKSEAATTTASVVQVREKMHTRSVGRWCHYEKELASLRDHLEAAGIATE